MLMLPEISFTLDAIPEVNTVFLLERKEQVTTLLADPSMVDFARTHLDLNDGVAHLNLIDHQLIVIAPPKDSLSMEHGLEWLRKKGHEVQRLLVKQKVKNIQVFGLGQLPLQVLALAEGVALSNYEFLKYKSDKTSHALHSITIGGGQVNARQVEELAITTAAVFTARDLINEPVSYLTAEQLSKEIAELASAHGFSFRYLKKKEIQELRMGGLLAVNWGSPEPPTFNILEYKPTKALNAKPVVLVGKGVVYDTGGLSLKPTPGSMDSMKSDMAGAAAVIGAISAIASAGLPFHIVGLIPATDNRPGGNAVTPGDVITMMSGKTVEVLNTDAEGRLILADALHYAKQYDPMLVLDLATLTGAAARAIGKEGTVYMGTADEETMTLAEEAGEEVCERLVNFPLWAEYEEYIKSDVADIKNIGPAEAGAITAGMFLKHFTDYPWLHLDIAGAAFKEGGEWNYRGKGGTGHGVRLLYSFLKKLLA